MNARAPGGRAPPRHTIGRPNRSTSPIVSAATSDRRSPPLRIMAGASQPAPVDQFRRPPPVARCRDREREDGLRHRPAQK